MSDAAAVSRPTGLPIALFGRAVLWFAIFLGGFVFYEPAPYELFLALVIPCWFFTNPQLPRAIAPLFFLMIAFMAGGFIAMTQAKDMGDQPIYYAVSGFLALSSCFYAAVLGANPRLYRIIVSAWIAAAVCTVFLGIVGYLGLSGELFTKYGRAAGGFQDPNVFGPFLIFPFIVLVRRALTQSLGRALLSGALAMFLFIGIFLSFSRGAWGLAVIAALMIGMLLFVTERSARGRARYIGLAAAGIAAIALLLAATLSIPAVRTLFEERARVVQDYDAGHLGRFQRHAIGFNMMVERPLGLGAMEFGKVYGEDEHDIWLKSLTTYGWLGFAAYVSLVLWTLIEAFPLLFRTGPLQGIVQVAYVVLAGHFLLGTVIDIDHWRHVYLLFGMLWGAIAAGGSARQVRLTDIRDGRPIAPSPLEAIV